MVPNDSLNNSSGQIHLFTLIWRSRLCHIIYAEFLMRYKLWLYFVLDFYLSLEWPSRRIFYSGDSPADRTVIDNEMLGCNKCITIRTKIPVFNILIRRPQFGKFVFRGFSCQFAGKWGEFACKWAKNYGYKYFGLSKCVNERCGNSRFNSWFELTRKFEFRKRAEISGKKFHWWKKFHFKEKLFHLDWFDWWMFQTVTCMLNLKN